MLRIAWFGEKVQKISARADGGPRYPSAHAWRSARPPIDTSRNFSAHVSGGGGENFQHIFLINFLAKSGNSMHFSFFHFLQKKFNCGQYFCLPSTKIVVTMFSFHFHNSSGMCLQYGPIWVNSQLTQSNISVNSKQPMMRLVKKSWDNQRQVS